MVGYVGVDQRGASLAYNLFIAYDLISPGQNYDQVKDAIRGLGKYWQAQYSLFYVHTQYAPREAFDIVIKTMDPNDKLAVINCADAIGAIVTNWDHPPIDEINAIWFTP